MTEDHRHTLALEFTFENAGILSFFAEWISEGTHGCRVVDVVGGILNGHHSKSNF